MNFEENYIALRDKEGRILTSAEIKKLPNLPGQHKLYDEFKLRKASIERLKPYLEKRRFIKAIDVGCGNGWFSHWLSDFVDQVIGVDINNFELDQAARIFPKSNLTFVKTEDLIALVEKEKPNLVIFNSSLQYFNPRHRTLEHLKDALKPNSEIHILDSQIHLTRKKAIQASRKSRKYYESQGFPEMYYHYFHYHLEQLSFVEWLFHPPAGLLGFFSKDRDAFPWGRIRV